MNNLLRQLLFLFSLCLHSCASPFAFADHVPATELYQLYQLHGADALLESLHEETEVLEQEWHDHDQQEVQAAASVSEALAGHLALNAAKISLVRAFKANSLIAGQLQEESMLDSPAAAFSIVATSPMSPSMRGFRSRRRAQRRMASVTETAQMDEAMKVLAEDPASMRFLRQSIGEFAQNYRSYLDEVRIATFFRARMTVALKPMLEEFRLKVREFIADQGGNTVDIEQRAWSSLSAGFDDIFMRNGQKVIQRLLETEAFSELSEQHALQMYTELLNRIGLAAPASRVGFGRTVVSLPLKSGGIFTYNFRYDQFFLDLHSFATNCVQAVRMSNLDSEARWSSPLISRLMDETPSSFTPSYIRGEIEETFKVLATELDDIHLRLLPFSELFGTGKAESVNKLLAQVVDESVTDDAAILRTFYQEQLATELEEVNHICSTTLAQSRSAVIGRRGTLMLRRLHEATGQLQYLRQQPAHVVVDLWQVVRRAGARRLRGIIPGAGAGLVVVLGFSGDEAHASEALPMAVEGAQQDFSELFDYYQKKPSAAEVERLEDILGKEESTSSPSDPL